MSYSSYSSCSGSRKQRTIVFCCSVVAHIGLLFVPMVLLFLDGLLLPKEEEEFNINIVETPAMAEEIAPVVQQPPPSEVDQPEESNPEPVPEPEITPPPVPEVPPMPEVAQPEIDLPQYVPEEEPQKRIAQPKIKLPPVPKAKPKPKPRPKQDRKLVNSKKTTPKSVKSKPDPRIPIGKTATGQVYGKNSNTPQGGKLDKNAYAKTLAAFLKMQWNTYTPTQAFIKDAKPETTVHLSISPAGKITSARIVKPSGVDAMDQAVIRMLQDLAKGTLPRPTDGNAWSDTVNFTID